MEVPRLGAKWELQLLAYATDAAAPDPSHICNLHHSSWQYRILKPLSEARDRTHNFTVPSRIHFHCTTTGTPSNEDLNVVTRYHLDHPYFPVCCGVTNLTK